MNGFLEELERIVDKLALLIKGLAPVAAAASVFAGPAAPAVLGGALAAGIIATGIDDAIKAHEASGGSQEGAIAGAMIITQAVASSSVLDPVTSARLASIVAGLNAPPTVGTIPIHDS